MTIGVDAGALAIRDERLKVGVHKITLRLLEELSRNDNKNSYRLYSFAPIEQGIVKKLGSSFNNIVLKPAYGFMKVRIPLELAMHPVDVFLGLSQSLPSSTSHNIGFIYDLGFLYNPEAYPDSLNRLRKQTEQLVRFADHIITISHASKRDIIDKYRIADDMLSVAYPGVDSGFQPQGPRIKPDRPYLLFVGSLNKAKDLPFLIHIFNVFLKNRKTDSVYDLYLVGGDFWPDPEIKETIQRYQLDERVKFLGFVSDDELIRYYRGATAFVTTALREGFCLPAVEAMACGTPVVAVNRGALLEIVGKGGIVVKSDSPDRFAQALHHIATDKDLRRNLSQQDLDQARKFTWNRFARSIHTIINSYAH